MCVEPDMGLRAWLSESCARTGIYVTSGRGALSLVKLEEEGFIRSTVSGIGLARLLNEGIVMVSSTRVLKTSGRWNNHCFDRGCRRIPLLTPQQAVGSLRHAVCARRGLHAAYSVLNRFLTSSEGSPYFAEPRGTVEEVNWLYHLLWGWVEVIRLDLADPDLWEVAMTTTSLRTFSLQEILALPSFTIDAKRRRCSFVFWTEDMEDKILSSLALFGMPVDKQDRMIIAVKELIGPVAAVCIWGADHRGQTAVLTNDNQNACCWINSRGNCRNPIAQYLIFALTRAETRNDLDVFAAYVNTKRNSVADEGTRVLTGLTSGAEAADRSSEYYEWASRTLPGYTVENWTEFVEELLLQAKNQSAPLLWTEPKSPTAVASRAGRRGAEPSSGIVAHSKNGVFEECCGNCAMTTSLVELGYESLGSSEIDEDALKFQRRVLGVANARAMDF